VASPIAFDGNTPSASYMDMVTRYSFDDDKDLSVTSNKWFNDVSADQSFTSSATPYGYTSPLGSGTNNTHFSSVVDETKMKVPNLGPSGRSSNKIRIEADTLIDPATKANPFLEFGKSITIPAYDNAPVDSNKLGVFFSPSAAIDEDIILSMPNLDFDQYIGDPRDQYNEEYTGLRTARDLYWKKYAGPNNFWDYLRLLKYYDSSLYKQVRSLIPARANAKVGIMIEPTVLERDKIVIGKKPSFEPQHYTVGLSTEIYVSESGDFTPLESDMSYSNPYGLRAGRQATGSYVSASGEYVPLESDMSYSNPYGIKAGRQATGSYVSASGEYLPLETSVGINYTNPFRLQSHTQETGSVVSASSEYLPLETFVGINYTNPFRLQSHTQETGSVVSASSEYPTYETQLGYTDPHRVNSHTKESGSFISSSAIYDAINMTSDLNLYDPYGLDPRGQTTGSTLLMTADFISYEAPSYTLAQLAAESGSFVLKHILERPSLFQIGDIDYSGWYGEDYNNATIQAGSQESIFLEVVMPTIEQNVTSDFNVEIEYYYSSAESASLGLYYSSSFLNTDLDSQTTYVSSGTDNLFFAGCENTDDSTVSDSANIYNNQSPAVEVTITSPTQLVTTDSPDTPLDVI